MYDDDGYDGYDDPCDWNQWEAEQVHQDDDAERQHQRLEWDKSFDEEVLVLFWADTGEVLGTYRLEERETALLVASLLPGAEVRPDTVHHPAVVLDGQQYAAMMERLADDEAGLEEYAEAVARFGPPPEPR